MTRTAGAKNKQTLLEQQHGRVCRSCDELKPLDRQHFYTTKPTVFMRECKVCNNQRRMRREKKNKKIQKK